MVKKLNRLRRIECNKALTSMQYILIYAEQRKYIDDNLKKVLDKFKNHITKSRICTKCNIEKPLTNEFFTWQNTRKTFRADCKICHRATVRLTEFKSRDRIKAYREKNKERHKEYLKKYYSIEKNKKNKIEWHKKWYEKNKKKKLKQNKEWSLKNKKRHKQLRLDWYKDNKHKCLASYHKRKRALNTQVPKWYDHKKVLAIFKKASDMRAKGKNVSVDHVIPLQAENVSGLHVHTNLKIISLSKNCGKKNKFDSNKPMEYYFGKNWKKII